MSEGFRQWVSGFTARQIVMWLAGCFCFSIGVKFFIEVNLGVSPLDVLVIGVATRVHTTIGIASGVIAILFLIIWSLWNRKLPPITTFLTMFLVGNLIDLWNLVDLQQYFTPWLPRYPMLAAALLLCSYASALIIMSGIGIRIMDLLGITMVFKWGISFFLAKMVQEVGFFVSGYFLGGPFGPATIAFILVVGPGISPLIWLNSTCLSMPNYGLKRPKPALPRLAASRA